MAALVIYHADGTNRRIDIGPAGLRIGRAAENDLILEDPDKGVSRFHAEIQLEDGQFVISDLNSQNGVFIEQRRISREVLLDGQEVRIGPYRLILAGDSVESAGL